jgi:hypothetical protein
MLIRCNSGVFLKLLIAVSSFGEILRLYLLTDLAEACFN